jgi:hypothetical protein
MIGEDWRTGVLYHIVHCLDGLACAEAPCISEDEGTPKAGFNRECSLPTNVQSAMLFSTSTLNAATQGYADWAVRQTMNTAGCTGHLDMRFAAFRYGSLFAVKIAHYEYSPSVSNYPSATNTETP